MTGEALRLRPFAGRSTCSPLLLGRDKTAQRLKGLIDIPGGGPSLQPAICRGGSCGCPTDLCHGFAAAAFQHAFMFWSLRCAGEAPAQGRRDARSDVRRCPVYRRRPTSTILCGTLANSDIARGVCQRVDAPCCPQARQPPKRLTLREALTGQLQGVHAAKENRLAR